MTGLFAFNFFNFYLPIFLVAVLSKFFEFNDTYFLILVQLCFKQVLVNFIELVLPYWSVNDKINLLKKEFKDGVVGEIIQS